jgi:diacylglycerol kinase family enzyme
MDRSTAPPLVIVNRNASQLTDPVRRERVAASLVRAVEARTGMTPVLVDSTPEAARSALATAAGAPLVAVAGGDGTIREAASALSGSGIPLAIVPAGTGNVFASSLGIPRQASMATRWIETGRIDHLDVGSASWGRVDVGAPLAGELAHDVGEMTFVVACGVGFDARVMAAATVEMKRRLGFLAYVVGAMREASRLRPVRFRIETDDAIHELQGLVVLIANCGQLIPGLVGPRRPIDPADGLLDVFVVQGTGVPSGLIGAAESVLAAGPPPHQGSRALRFQARRVRVTSDPREPVQVDGDAHEARWLEASVRPGALTVLRP